MVQEHLELSRCPHCNVAKPLLQRKWHDEDLEKSYPEFWGLFQCSKCGKYVLTLSLFVPEFPPTIWPEVETVDTTGPARARGYLEQAIASLHAPAGAVMLTASAVDAMLKEKGYSDGDLYPRIDKAKDDHLITEEMALWAHEIRLDANLQRHADESTPLPMEADARKVIEFAQALAQFLFVLPARVRRGRSIPGTT